MADIFSGWNAVQNARPMAPPSSLPQIATLGNLVDVLEQRRAARAAAERQQQMDALAMRKQEERDAYYRRKLDLQEQRQTSKDAMDRAKYNQQIYQDVQGKAAKGLHPGTQLFMDDQGNPIRVAPRFVPHEQAPAAPQAPAQHPLIRPASLESANAIAQVQTSRPPAVSRIRNPDKSWTVARPEVYQDSDGNYAVIPAVNPDAPDRATVSREGAIGAYVRGGGALGKFRTREEAEALADRIYMREAAKNLWDTSQGTDPNGRDPALPAESFQNEQAPAAPQAPAQHPLIRPASLESTNAMAQVQTNREPQLSRRRNADDSWSVVRPEVVLDQDGKYTVIPGVDPDWPGASVATRRSAEQYYARFGKHLGKYDSEDEANKRADAIYLREAAKHLIDSEPHWTPGYDPALRDSTGNPLPGNLPDTGFPVPPEAFQKIGFGGQEPRYAVAQALDRNPDADSADELGMGPQLSPEEAQDIEARRSRLIQGDPGGNIDLENPPPPVDYQEPQEGDLPPAGLMSPEESKSRLDELGVPPLPPKGEQPSFQALQDALDSRGSNVPQAEAAQPADEFKRGKWVYDIPGGQPFEIDLEQARAAHQEEIKSRIAQIDRVLTNPTYANSPMLPRLEQERMMLEAEIGGNAASQLRGQIGKEGLQSQKDAAAMDRAKVGIEGRESLEKLRQEGKIALQNAKRKKGGGGGLGMGTMGVGGGEYINIPMTRGGPRPDLLLGRVTQDWRSFSLDEKLPVQLLGLRRLKLADHNMQANGPHSGVLNIEAAFNYLGFIRGGVPVKNETDEMLKERRTWADRIHGVLARAGLGELAAKFMKGDELTKDEAAAAVNVMSPAEKARIAEGIRESLAVMQGQVNDTLKPFVMQYATFDGPGGKLMRQQALGIVNSRLQTAGLPADFNPFNDTIIPNTSKHMKPGAMGEQPQVGAPPAPAPQSSGGEKKPSFDEALQKILEMKKKAKGGQ